MKELKDKAGKKILAYNLDGLPVVGYNPYGKEKLGVVDKDEDGVPYLGYDKNGTPALGIKEDVPGPKQAP